MSPIPRPSARPPTTLASPSIPVASRRRTRKSTSSPAWTRRTPPSSGSSTAARLVASARSGLGASRAGGTTWTTWTNLTDGQHVIELGWQSGTSTSLRLWIDGVAGPTASSLDTHGYRLEAVRLGPSAGLTSSMTGRAPIRPIRLEPRLDDRPVGAMRIRRAAGRRLALLLILEVLFGVVAVGVLGTDAASAAAITSATSRSSSSSGRSVPSPSRYRALGEEAAAAARKRSDDVVTVYSPNATWPAVRRALAGASIVVYLGHGNGWPSPYRDALYGRTQNGLGLNPVAGVDNEAHQYFGERYLADKVRLAPGAVVILGHLCYASGNPEPGGPDPTLDVAQQRADNYAAGWMAAGATAVIAEGHGRPAYYVAALLKAPRHHRAHVAGRAHVQRPRHRDAERPDDRHDRDARPRPTIARILPITRGGPRRAHRSLAGRRAGRRVGASRPTRCLCRRPSGGPDSVLPALDGMPVAGTEAALTLVADATTLDLLPDGVSIGARWDPMTPAAPKPDDAAPGDAATASAGAPAVTKGPSPDAGADPAAGVPSVDLSSRGSSATEPAPRLDDPPSIDLIGPETLGTVVSVASASRTPDGLAIPIAMPEEPGLYRLVTTVHDSEGVAFDAETQALIPALLVRVSASMSAAYAAPAELHPDPDEAFGVRVRVVNTGNGHLATARADRSGPRTARTRRWRTTPRRPVDRTR